MLKKERRQFECEIFGTDMDPEAIRSAVAGEYLDAELEEVKKKYLDAYFERVPRRHETSLGGDTLFRLRGEIIDMVRFSCSDVTRMLLPNQTVFKPFHLVLCRNILIYMSRDLQEEMLAAIAARIMGNGYLVLGETETLPERLRQEFIQPYPPAKLFRKKPEGLPELPDAEIP